MNEWMTLYFNPFWNHFSSHISFLQLLFSIYSHHTHAVSIWESLNLFANRRKMVRNRTLPHKKKCTSQTWLPDHVMENLPMTCRSTLPDCSPNSPRFRGTWLTEMACHWVLLHCTVRFSMTWPGSHARLWILFLCVGSCSFFFCVCEAVHFFLYVAHVVE